MSGGMGGKLVQAGLIVDPTFAMAGEANFLLRCTRRLSKNEMLLSMSEEEWNAAEADQYIASGVDGHSTEEMELAVIRRSGRITHCCAGGATTRLPARQLSPRAQAPRALGGGYYCAPGVLNRSSTAPAGSAARCVGW